MKRYQVIVIGGGPGGSHAATYLARAGYDVAIFEREQYPRFHIGESLLPASMPMFKETGFYKVLDEGNYIKKYGANFIDYETEDRVYFGFEDGFNADIPMAFEVERAHFDRDILQYAVNSGAKLHQPERITEVQPFDDHVEIRTNKGVYAADFILDATGRDALVGRKYATRSVNKDLNNVAVFAHYVDVKRYPGKHEGDITVGLLPNRSWTWIIPFKGDRTSVGVVCSSSHFENKGDILAHMEDYLQRSDRVREMISGAQRCTEVQMIGNYSHTTDTFFGSRWMLIGDAAVFLDPIFSTGVHVSLTSGMLAARATMKCITEGLTYEQKNLGRNYQEMVMKGVGRFKNLVGLFYDGNFVAQMKKTLVRENMRKAFTSAVAGDAWNDDNFLFQKSVL